MSSETEQFGVHLLLDAYGADPELLSDPELLRSVLIDVPRQLGMHPISTPIVVEVGQQNRKDPGGLSGFVLIAESHISFHTFPKRRFVTADVYTCQGELDTELLLSAFRLAFGTQDFDVSIIPRGVRYPVANIA